MPTSRQAIKRQLEQVRYVIDFYNAAPMPNMPVAMHLDVRPALDSLEAAWDRLAVHWTGVARGIRDRLFPAPQPETKTAASKQH